MDWALGGTLGPIALIAGLVDGHASSVWIGVALCCVWALDLLLDWMAVRALTARRSTWTPWQEPKLGRSRS
jgi:hypothetical protein